MVQNCSYGTNLGVLACSVYDIVQILIGIFKNYI